MFGHVARDGSRILWRIEGDAGDQSGFESEKLLDRKSRSRERKSKMMKNSYERVIVRSNRGTLCFLRSLTL